MHSSLGSDQPDADLLELIESLDWRAVDNYLQHLLIPSGKYHMDHVRQILYRSDEDSSTPVTLLLWHRAPTGVLKSFFKISQHEKVVPLLHKDKFNPLATRDTVSFWRLPLLRLSLTTCLTALSLASSLFRSSHCQLVCALNTNSKPHCRRCAPPPPRSSTLALSTSSPATTTTPTSPQ